MISILIALLLCGSALWLINRFLTEPARMIFQIVVVFVLIFWLLSVFGFMDTMRLPHHTLR